MPVISHHLTLPPAPQDEYRDVLHKAVAKVSSGMASSSSSSGELSEQRKDKIRKVVEAYMAAALKARGKAGL